MAAGLALPESNPGFAWNGVRQQLDLFACAIVQFHIAR